MGDWHGQRYTLGHFLETIQSLRQLQSASSSLFLGVRKMYVHFTSGSGFLKALYKFNWFSYQLMGLILSMGFSRQEYRSGFPFPETPGVTGKFGLGIQNEAGQRLIDFCQENALVIANTLFQQHRIKLYTWTSPDGQHRNQTDYILCSQRWRSSIQSAKTRPGADCGSDHELLIAKFRLKLK